jgi:cytochrome P450
MMYSPLSAPQPVDRAVRPRGLLTSPSDIAASGRSLRGEAHPSPAGPVEAPADEGLREPPAVALPRVAQVLLLTWNQHAFMFRARARLGDVFRTNSYVPGRPVVTCHPDHARSLFTAAPELVPTLAAESPLRPVLGPNSVLTANGPRHLHQRKLLLPPFHGNAIARYREMIAKAVEREIDAWPVGRAFALAPRMQDITLEVIMGGIFGIEGRPRPGTLEHALRLAIRQLLAASIKPHAKLGELLNLGRHEPIGLLRLGLFVPDRLLYALIAKRRRAADLEERCDILSLLLRSTDDAGERLSDRELRDELMTLVLAGHETTANQLAWTWERVVRTPAAYALLRESVRGGHPDVSHVIEAAITEGMRTRPVIPITGRRVAVGWRLGPYYVPPGTPIAISILLLHHREDLYPDPFAFRLERWLERAPTDGDNGGATGGSGSSFAKPGTYEWIPFGGGTRRCLGATLAMAEQRAVVEAMARRLDLVAVDERPERPKHRNVTMIPARGARIVVRSRLR